MDRVCIGIDVGGTTVKFGLFKQNGDLLEKWEIPTRKENGGEAILPDIADSVLRKMEDKGYEKKDVKGIGIGIPGPVTRGVVAEAVNLHWGETDVEGILKKLTGLTVRARNDANVAALGEMWQGGGAGRKNLILATLGTGIGGGIIINGHILEGSHGAGGEIGHAHMDDNIKDPCNCGNRGCLEQLASATGIERLTREELAAEPDLNTVLRNIPNANSKDVFDAYKNHDPAAEKIVNRFANYLGTALAIFSCVTDPEVIILGGGVSKAGQPLVDAVSRYYREDAFNVCKNTPIVLAKLGNDAGIYGAAYLVVSH